MSDNVSDRGGEWFLKKGMASLMSRLRPSPPPPSPLVDNPIYRLFEIGAEVGTCGPQLLWRIHDARRKQDGMYCTVLIFDKKNADKMCKSKRKEAFVAKFRDGVAQLACLDSPSLLKVIHPMEEGPINLAFATEACLSSLYNILLWQSLTPVPVNMAQPVEASPSPKHEPRALPSGNPELQPHVKRYLFLDIELRFGIMQLISALKYLHGSAYQLHRNMCPEIVVVTKRGTWKIMGLDFAEPIGAFSELTVMDPVTVAPWTTRQPIEVQPNLDYIAPEVQKHAQANNLSDMFSLGLLICTIFNNGCPLIQAKNNPSLYYKQIENLDRQVQSLLPRIPAELKEVVLRLVSKDPTPRPSAQQLRVINYFKGSCELAVHALQFLETLGQKDFAAREQFYRRTLIDALPMIPQKLRWSLVWPFISAQISTEETLHALLQPILWIVANATAEEYTEHMQEPMMYMYRLMMSPQRPLTATGLMLESFHVVIEKSTREDIEDYILPVMYNLLDCNDQSIQTAVLVAAQTLWSFAKDKDLHELLLPGVKIIIDKNKTNSKICHLGLGLFEIIMPRLNRELVVDICVPAVLSIRLFDPTVVVRVVQLHRTFLTEPRFGLDTTVMATKMLPSLMPATINPFLNEEQFTILLDMLYDMLNNIEENQLQRISLQSTDEPVPPPARGQLLAYQFFIDQVEPPEFVIPDMSRCRRTPPSAETAVRNNAASAPPPPPEAEGAASTSGFRGTGIGQWLLGTNNSTGAGPIDTNFLRALIPFPGRRLSDNTNITPKIRIAPSCASSPGGTPGGGAPASPSSELSSRRHSSIGRDSNVLLSPPSARTGRKRGSGCSLKVPSEHRPADDDAPNQSSSVPFLLSSSLNSVHSRGQPQASPGSSLLRQLGSGVVRHFPGGSPVEQARRLKPQWRALRRATAAAGNALQSTAGAAVRKCHTFNIKLG